MFDMLGTIIKNVFSKPATRMYPQKPRQDFKNTRGSIDVKIEDCIFCGICARKCPPDALVVNRQEKSWEIDPYKCIICGACSDACPKKCIIVNEKYPEIVYEKKKLKSVQVVTETKEVKEQVKK